MAPTALALAFLLTAGCDYAWLSDQGKHDPDEDTHDGNESGFDSYGEDNSSDDDDSYDDNYDDNYDDDYDDDYDDNLDDDYDDDWEDDSDSVTDTDTEPDTDPAAETAVYAEDECDPETGYEYSLTVDDSNDTSSPAAARWQILADSLVTVEIRRQAFLNYYSIGLEAPDPGYLTATAELLPLDDDAGTHALQIGVRGESVSNEDRRPLNLVLCVDTSGSMGGSPMQRFKAVGNAIAGNLEDGDIVSIVKWSNTDAVLLNSHTVDGPDDPTLLAVIDGMAAGGATNLYAGLLEAYVLAMGNATSFRANRVVLISDGQVNAGIDELDLIAELAEDSEDEGIYLLGIGVGNGYDDTLMDDVTAAGKGAYVFVDTVGEAAGMFGDPDRFVSLFEIAARDVELELTLPAGWYIEELHGPPDTPAPSVGAAQHLWANEEMIFHYLVTPCGDPEPLESASFSAALSYATGTGPYSPGLESINFSFSDFVEEPSAQMLKSRAVLLYASALEQIQPLMWSSSNYTLVLEIIDSARASIQETSAALGDDGELNEIDQLLEEYRTKFD